MNHVPKKSLGQNFLTSEAILDKIIDASNIHPDDIVLEIGPGKGALTKKLIPLAGKVIAVEKDDSLYGYLTETFAEFVKNERFHLINGDILEFNPEEIRNLAKNPESSPLKAISYKLIANIPYNITGAIIEKFLSAAFQPKMMVLMVQKEVADRIIAKNKGTGGKSGTPGKESILSIAVKAYGTPTYICTVKAGNFFPAPNVDSAVIRIEGISRSHFANKHHEEVFFQVVKAGFAHKRKTLGGNLKNILEPSIVADALAHANLEPGMRAEDMGIDEWLSLARFVYNETYGTNA